MDYDLTAYLLGLAAALLVGLSKTGIPGVAIPAIVFMTEAFAGNEKLSVGALLPVLLVGDLFAVGFYRRHAEWNRLGGLFPYVVAGMVPAAVVLLLVADQHFKLVLGWIVLALLGLEVGRQRFGWTGMPGRWWFVAVAGLLAGFGTTVGNAAGPVMSVYLISRGLPKEQFMGTWAWFFLIVNLAKGRLGEDNSALLGAMLITKIQLTAMSRVDLPEKERKDFYLYVDEFQNFATDSFVNILSEARKYRLSLTLANQYISQMPEAVRDAVFGNVGTIIAFRVGAYDAKVLEQEFEPVFSVFDIVSLPRYQIYLRLMIDGVVSPAFSAVTLPPFQRPARSRKQKIIMLSRQRYASIRCDVEGKISNTYL